MREQISADIDWDSLRDEANYLGMSNAMIDKVLAAVHEFLPAARFSDQLDEEIVFTLVERKRLFGARNGRFAE